MRAKEWKLFVILKDMDDNRAFKTFTILFMAV
ncbi:hypothetical protein [uncultured Brevibacillus sp.]